MCKYRVKIDELQNGQKRYTPQKSIRLGFWNRWENIYFSFDTEEQALKQIEGHRKEKEVKSTTYKMINE
jgi:ribulose bisphosphate carboxylase small subunit